MHVTESAINRVSFLKEKEKDNDLMFRVYITGGGCYGFQYGFKLESIAADDYLQITYENTLVLVDPMSYQYLEGCTIDFKQDLQGARFTVKNPNAQTTCGCGSSFAV